MIDEHPFRLVDLLAAQNLGLQLMTESDPDTPIHGAHAIEIENPSRWLKPGWLMLTTGARFSGPANTAEQQRELVRELQSAGTAAVAFGVGISLEDVPRPLLDEAERCGFPVLSVPLPTAFLEVIDVVNKATLTRDVYLLKRTVSIQDYLLESLAARNATSTLVHRLAELLRGTVVLYDQSGTIVASSGVGPMQLIRSEIARYPAQRRRFTVGRWHVLTDPIRTDETMHWLAVASRRQSVSEDLAEPAMEATRRLVTMLVRSRETVQLEDRLRRAELVRMVISGKQSLDGQYVWDRLEMHRFRRDEAVRLLMVTDTQWLAENDKFSLVARLERAAPLESAALDIDLPLLFGAHGDQIAGVVRAEDTALRRWLDRLTATVHCGLSSPFGDLSLGPTRLREAELALASASRDGHRTVRFENIGLVEWLIAGRDADAVAAKARQVLAGIANNATMLETLTEYFRNDCDIQRTAHKLELHPNSVRYRLKRASAAVGCDLRSPADLAELALGIRLLDQ